jgi:hypothetical protein
MRKEIGYSLKKVLWPVVVLGSLLVVTIIVVACSSFTAGTGAAGMANVKVMLSDPATCGSPGGPFSHVFVTITDVQANVNASAGPNDSGWKDLTPGLAKNPRQIDLLAQANNQCFLAQLGDTQQLQAGAYQQIRLLLVDNSLTVSGNSCGSSANCVMLTSDSSNSPYALQLSSEAQTGIKIPSGQIAGGGFTIAAGQTKDLDIDFMTCESIVQEGNHQFRLKPVLHAGEVSTTSSSINGKVLDSATGNPVSGNVDVALEQPDGSGIDRVIMSAPVGADGGFVFCPLPSGTYDVVIVGTRTDGLLYQPSIVTGVATGNTAGTVNLYPPPVAITTASSSANLTGLVTSAGASGAVPAEVTLSVLETVNSKTYTIPQQPAASPYFAVMAVVDTAASNPPTTSCPTGADCINYSLPVSSGGPYIGAWSAGGTTLSPGSSVTSLGSFAVDGTTTTCSTADVTTSPAITLTGTGPFATVPITPDLAFTGCQ